METPSFYRYLNDVLGIESVVMPAVERSNELVVEGQGPILFLGSTILSEPREKELLHKMIVAMGLDPAQVYIAEGEPSSLDVLKNYDFKILILMGSDVSESLQDPSSQKKWIWSELFYEQNWKILITYDPKSLLKNPDLKKQAWNDLKKVIPLLKA